MATRSALVAVSAAQLAAGLAGQLVALRRRRNYDVGFMKGSPAHVGRDSLWAGTAYSAPITMLAAQAWATARLRRGPNDGARRLLETPVLLAGLGLAAAMGVLGHRDQAGR